MASSRGTPSQVLWSIPRALREIEWTVTVRAERMADLSKGKRCLTTA
jgi:hypothetical protein